MGDLLPSDAEADTGSRPASLSQGYEAADVGKPNKPGSLSILNLARQEDGL